MRLASAFPGFQLRLTRWGGIFLVVVLVLGVAAVNTGNNALMAILGLALGSYIVSGAWSRQVLGSVTADLSRPRDVFAGRKAVLEVGLVNRSRLLPAYGLVLRHQDGHALLVEELLDARASRHRTVITSYSRRGWQSVGPIRLEVSLPLGFFVKSKRVFVGEQVLVYPRLLKGALHELDREGGEHSPERWRPRGREGDVTQLRDFREGDEQRQIHWKQSARQQRLIAVDRHSEARAPVFLTLDLRVSDPNDPEVLDRFERRVSVVATGVVRRLQQGEAVGLVVGATVIPPVLGLERLGLLMRPLAEAAPIPDDGPAPAAADGAPRVGSQLRDSA